MENDPSSDGVEKVYLDMLNLALSEFSESEKVHQHDYRIKHGISHWKCIFSSYEAKTKCIFTTLFTRISVICSQVQILSIVSVSEMNLNVISTVLNSENKAWKIFRSIRDLNPWLTRFQCIVNVWYRAKHNDMHMFISSFHTSDPSVWPRKTGWQEL